ncbi:ribbon-helix-helix protein, CopG family [uncultured Thiodictyon sp.]|uniref:CopG family ribbon-helix-helix protein n=1 Tax=uncultured Thiodictyon sp. TaxID=1846217 RepID=UPI0025F26FE5|nr:ribbon-helix-helix protein, CopG family [uncultured Thiodictyon sp.]
MSTMTLSLSDETDQALDALVQATARTKSDLVERAVVAFLSHNAWQVAAICEEIAQADAGELIDHQSVRRRWEAKLAAALA